MTSVWFFCDAVPSQSLLGCFSCSSDPNHIVLNDFYFQVQCTSALSFIFSSKLCCCLYVNYILHHNYLGMILFSKSQVIIFGVFSFLSNYVVFWITRARNLIFRNLREMFKLDAADYMMSICGDDGLRELSSPGKSGSLFYLSHDDRFVIKTLRKSELKVWT